MTIGILGTKVGMTQVFDDSGFAIPVTVIKAGPCIITQIKNTEKEGYNAVQIGYSESSPQKITKPCLGHLTKSKLPPLKHLKEYRVDSTDGGRLGGKKTTIKNLEVIYINSKDNLLVVRGSVPGKSGNLLSIR